MATHLAPARPLPPVGATLLCLERGSTAAYPVTVERHVGRYFIAGGHRFHVYDDWKSGASRPTWRKPAATVTLLTPEEAQEAAARILVADPPFQPPAEPVGAHEPTEAW